MKFIIHYKKIIFLFICFFIFFNFIFAQESIVQCRTARECNWQELVNTFGRLIKTIVIISFWIAFLLTTIGSFLIMFHGPNEALYKKGVDMIKIAIWGYLLILGSGIIFDIILDFFGPIQFKKTSLINFTFAANSTSSSDSAAPTGWYLFLKENVMSHLKCGKEATSTLNRLFSCIFEAIDVLKNIAVVFLALAIIVSAGYIISVPLFGLKNIPKAYQVLIWSIIGLVVILLADLIKAQIEKLVE